ncbi:hypothetical protein HJC23_001636 [Cyclotella cryptica]|uniref:Uncharacterized protein n=1 Tax=Cyclotella cryptica TaxID=29204 RepID=A0ABD3QJX7_9STRA|eukprot:CCRYP_004677-RA/>CCRYP_004677-RA protein AED:0.00 eAED:0.00 QI:125/-1/1/1/-1/1/1/330/600
MHPRFILPLALVLVPNGKHDGNCRGRSNSMLLDAATRSSYPYSMVSFVSTHPDVPLRKTTYHLRTSLGSSYNSRLRLVNGYDDCTRVFRRHCRNSGSTSTSLLADLSMYSSSNTIAASGTLLIGTLFGLLFDKISKTSGGGHVLTLLFAALVSNLSQVMSRVPRVPTEHFLYDWCWGLFLPASLVFALLSSSSSSKQLSDDTESQSTPSSTDFNVTRNCILNMATPFVIGSIGSILGCIVSFIFVPMTTLTSQSTSSIVPSKITTAILAGCLCGSYIGGTVNFFAAAKLLTPLASSNDMGSMFGSMAAADLVVMALYFAVLSAASKSSWMHKLFPSKSNGFDSMDRDKTISNTVTTMATSTTRGAVFNRLGATSMAISVAFSSVRLASQLEKIVSFRYNIPGTMCAFLALLGLSFNKLIANGIKVFESLTTCSSKPGRRSGFIRAVSTYVSRTLQQIPVVGPVLCNLSFFFLFAAVGATADISSAIYGGPMALIFATVALMVHCVTLLLGSVISSKIGGPMWPRASWEEILTASNAAIGGPSTAAAFAAGLVPNSSTSMDTNSRYRQALVISATVYGVLGYALGTSIGVILTKFLIRWIT